jgi:ABC-2 type transport system permease protein
VRRVLLLLRKDLRVLRRSPALVAALVVYPLVIAVLVGLVAGYGSSKPRVALVDEEGLPQIVTIAGHAFHVDRTISEVSRNVRHVRLDAAEAERQLQAGKIVASITVPPGFVADLQTTLRPPTLVLRTTRGGVSPRVRQQVQALVYTLNRLLQDALVRENLRYVSLILHGGSGTLLGREFHVIGLDGAQRLLRELPPGADRDRLVDFVHDARLALANAAGAIRATANPIRLREDPGRGRSALLSAQVQAYALALTVTFLALLLAATSLAAERDENAIGRLARGLVTLGQLVWAKVLLATVVALVLGLGIAVAFGIVVEARHVVGGEPWNRIPLLAVALVLAGAALGGLGALLGALARETRTASLVALLVVLPVVFLGLIPREVVPLAGWVSDALPFAHAFRFFDAALYDASPWAAAGRETLWLLGLGAVFGVLARLGTRRLVG